MFFVQKVEEEVELTKGSCVRVVTAESEKDKTDGTLIWVDYPSLPKVLKKDSMIYIDDGLIGLKVLETGQQARITESLQPLLYRLRGHFRTILGCIK